MRLAITICLFIATTLAPTLTRAVAPASGGEKLRQLVMLPMIKMEIHFGYSSTDGFHVKGDPDDLPREITQLRAALKSRPTDPALHLQLARKLGKLDNDPAVTAEATRAKARAVELYRQQVEAHPQDAALLAKLGEALSIAEQPGEAERVLRQAVQLGASDWRTWDARGDFHSGRVVDKLIALCGEGAKHFEFLQLLEALQRRKPSPADIEELEKLNTEARQCFDKAIALAPKEPEVYFTRGRQNGFLTAVDLVIKQLRGGGETRPDTLRLLIAGEGAMDDFRTALHLGATNYLATAYLAWLEVMVPAIKSGADFAPGAVEFSRLPEATQRAVSEALAHLENLSQTPNKEFSARVLEVRGYLQMLLRVDSDSAFQTLRRAVKLDPGRYGAWEGLIGIAYSGKSKEELVEICRERLQFKDTSRNRLLMIKALDHADKADQALAQAQAFFARAKDEPLANFALFAVMLKQAKTEAALVELDPQLDKCGKLFQKQVNPDEREQFGRLFVDTGIYYALTGRRTEARAILRKAMQLLPDDKTVVEVMQAMAD